VLSDTAESLPRKLRMRAEFCRDPVELHCEDSGCIRILYFFQVMSLHSSLTSFFLENRNPGSNNSTTLSTVSVRAWVGFVGSREWGKLTENCSVHTPLRDDHLESLLFVAHYS
jgi:hypothetical protein